MQSAAQYINCVLPRGAAGKTLYVSVKNIAQSPESAAVCVPAAVASMGVTLMTQQSSPVESSSASFRCV